MIPLLEPQVNTPNELTPIWRLAFRPFFLGACLFSVIAIFLWWASLRGYLQINVYGNWLWWHAHEMIFGFACAIIVGFLLTAVQTWTGIPGIKGKALAGLFMLWLSARIGMFLPLPFFAVVLLDSAFLFVAAFVLARPLLKVHMYRNLIFIVILLALMLLNIASHYALTRPANPAPFFHTSIMLIVLMITVMGGRIIPLFTNNALKIKSPAVPKWIELSAIGSSILLSIFALVGFLSLPASLITLVAGVGIIAHCYRLCCWFNKGILNKPILWSLHLAYSFLPMGLLLILLQSLGAAVISSLFIHSFTVGGIGGLILAMISRVALGHTGRPLILPRLMPAALCILFSGAFIRVLLPWADMQFYALALDASALAWGLAFSFFVISYGPFLLSPRADGKTG